MDRDYNEETYSFYQDELIHIYGRILFKLIYLISEIAIEQSFYSNSDDNEQNVYDENKNDSGDEGMKEVMEQHRLLALIKYILKTISLKTLIKKCGLKTTYFQFMIVNFSLSNHTPKVTNSLTQEILKNPLLYIFTLF